MTKSENEMLINLLQQVSKLNNELSNHTTKRLRKADDFLGPIAFAPHFKKIDSMVNFLLVNLENNQPLNNPNMFGTIKEHYFLKND